MEATTALPRPAPIELLNRIDWKGVSTWLLGFVLIVYLSLKGGGYDPFVRNQLGIIAWWGVLLGLAVGAIPLNKLRYGSWLALSLLAAYVIWVAISCAWTDVTEYTVADLGRVATYLGIFALALSVRGAKGARRMAGAIGAGIAVVALVALLSRLHPAWFPDAWQTVRFGSRQRLDYPLGYLESGAGGGDLFEGGDRRNGPAQPQSRGPARAGGGAWPGGAAHPPGGAGGGDPVKTDRRRGQRGRGRGAGA
jgi:hypothetical protein